MKETKRSEKVRREKESKKKRGSGYLYSVGGEKILFLFFWSWLLVSFLYF